MFAVSGIVRDNATRAELSTGKIDRRNKHPNACGICKNRWFYSNHLFLQIPLDLLGEIIGGLGKGQAVGTQNLPEFAIRLCAGEELQGTVPGHIAVGKRVVLSQKVAMGFIVGEKKLGTGVSFR